MNLVTNLYNTLSQGYINTFLDKYTYKNILYVVNSSIHVHKFVHKHIIIFEL